ncbi:MAG: hypothetical protein CM15mP117_07230 [Alphaproteobacteria bacterium]|nr:MAG: hypothetical protein CM15mP117_07230 [Alphaproteobacteria bacterium]
MVFTLSDSEWLQTNYNCEVVTFTAGIGQGEDITQVKNKAKLHGVKKIFIEDLREEFVSEYVFPMFRANAIYEGEYLLGTSIARPLIAKRQIEIAREVGAMQYLMEPRKKVMTGFRFEFGLLCATT